METKSRYEMIAEMEDKKRNLILQRDSFPYTVQVKQKEIKLLKRNIEDLEEELKQYEDSIEQQKGTLNEMIESINDTLKRLGSQKK